MVSLNLKRRDLTSSQKAVIGFDLLPLLAREAKERQARGHYNAPQYKDNQVSQKIDTPEEQQGRAAEQAAKLVGTNRQYISDVQTIQKEAPE